MFEHPDLVKLVFGRLTWEAIPLHEPILLTTFVAIVIGGVAVVAAMTYFRTWGTLWRNWITSIDHKKIGVMYVILGLVMLLRGFADAVMMRAHQAIAFGDAMGYLPPHHYDQIFTAHGVIMVLFVAMPLVTGLMNFAVPLQIGARDVAFPFLNNFSFWMTACGAVLAVLRALFAVLSLERYVGTTLCTHDVGGTPMMYVNLIWIWGDPEVYILILPAFGVYSEVASTFCGKRLFGYASLVYATVVITI